MSKFVLMFHGEFNCMKTINVKKNVRKISDEAFDC